MPTLPSTSREALTDLEAAVLKRGGDFNFRKHYNITDPDTESFYFDIYGEPACIVGYVLAARGFKAEDFVGKPMNHFAVHGLYAAINGVPSPATGLWGAMEVLGAAQTVQDAGGTWDEAVTMAHKVYQDIKRKQGV